MLLKRIAEQEKECELFMSFLPFHSHDVLGASAAHMIRFAAVSDLSP